MFESALAEVERLVRLQNRWRGSQTLNLIASENVLSGRARRLLGSDFAHRYAEGHPGERYYQGTDLIDIIESKAKENTKTLFRCRRADVRPISGTNANEAVISALVQSGDLVYANSLPAGGHISHQRYGTLGKATRKIRQIPLSADGVTTDTAALRDRIAKEKPKLVILGRSLFLFPEPVQEVAEVCRETGTLLLFDGAHVLGLIAGGAIPNPLEQGADILNGSTHKTFFGPQRGVVLSNLDDERWASIDKGVFPGSSSNHHLDTLPPYLVATYEMIAFGRAYAAQVVANAKTLAAALDKRGFAVAFKERGYTETHQVAVDVRSHGGGARASRVLQENDIILNMNYLPGDRSKDRANPSGVRIGVQEMTRIGMGEAEMEEIARLVWECLDRGVDVKAEVRALRGRFLQVRYSFDSGVEPPLFLTHPWSLDREQADKALAWQS